MNKITLLIALLDAMSSDQFKDLQDQIQTVRSKKGQKGPRGPRGDDFNFDENKDEIRDIISSYVDSIQDNLKLKFQDLSETEKNTLALKFENLSDEQLESLKGSKGPRGQRGKPGANGLDGKDGAEGKPGKDGQDGAKGPTGKAGKDFDFQLVKQNVFCFLEDLFNEQKESLSFKYEDFSEEQLDAFKLKFSDLDFEEKKEIRGPRGLKGQRGRQGIQGEAGLDGKNGTNGLDGKNGLNGVDGIDGVNGRAGQNGKHGKNGKNAPIITEVKLKKYNKDKFYFEFYYSDGSSTKTNKIKLPLIETFIQSAVAFGSTGGGLSALEIQKDGVKSGDAEVINFEGDNITVDFDEPTKTATVSVEQQDTCIPVADEGVRVTGCLKSIDFVGAFVKVENKTIMSDWATLTEVEPSLAGYEAVNPGHVTVTIDEPDASNIILKNVICNADTYTGSWVYRDPAKIFQNAIATSLATSNVMGTIEKKINATLCDVRVTGVTPEHYLGLDVTKEYFLSDTIPGGMQTNIPVTSGHVNLKLGQPFSDKDFLQLKGERVVRG